MFGKFRQHSKIIICLLVVVLLMGDPTMANGLLDTKNMSDATFLQQLTTLLAWIWIPLARGAGKLMSNGFVYGEFMNFDIYLWQMWNISKNFANIAIGLFFLVYIFRTLFQKDQLTGNEIGKKMGGFLVASVLIQASWFMMGALLDIEKIATSAMGALPGMVIQENNARGQKVVDTMTNSQALGKAISLDKAAPDQKLLKINTTAPDYSINTGNESILDAILPRYDMLSGPLFFIGFGMFQFHSYGETQFNVNNIQEISWLLTSSGIKLLVVGAFAIMMLILFVANIIRVAYLWMVIALAPIIILYLVLKHIVGMQIGGDSDTILSKINIPTILAYIFQPTIIVMFMGFMIITVAGLWNSMSATTQTIEEYGFTITTGSVEHSTFYLQTQGQLLSNIANTGRGIFQDLLLVILVFALLMGLIVLTTTLLKIEFLNKAAKSLGNALAGVPMIPVFTVAKAGGNVLRDTTGIDLVTGDPSRRGKLDSKGENAMRQLLGLDTLNDKKDDAYIRDIDSSIKNPDAFGKNFSAWIEHKGETGITLTGSNTTAQAKELIEKFIKENHDKNTWLSKIDNMDDFNLEEYLKINNGKNLQYMYNLIMGINLNTSIPSELTASTFLTRPIKKPSPKK